MPTGYTSEIANGITFPEFAMRCARAFGALSTMRDEPFDAAIPVKFEPSAFYKEKAAALESEIATLEAMSLDDADRQAAAAYEAEVGHYRKCLEEARDLRQKYEAMLAQVEAWEPPTADHGELKTFMRQQIEESIRFDCSTSWLKHPVPLGGAKWRAKELDSKHQSLARYREEFERDCRLAKDRTAWVAALRESLEVQS